MAVDAGVWFQKIVDIFSLISGRLQENVDQAQLAKVINAALASLPAGATHSDQFFAIESAIAKSSDTIFIGKGWFAQLAQTALLVVRATHGA